MSENEFFDKNISDNQFKNTDLYKMQRYQDQILEKTLS